jgi:hypothetical protein
MSLIRPGRLLRAGDRQDTLAAAAAFLHTVLDFVRIRTGPMSVLVVLMHLRPASSNEERTDMFQTLGVQQNHQTHFD